MRRHINCSASLRHLTPVLLITLFLCPTFASAQSTVTVTGTVNWTDGQNLLHPTRLDQVQIVGNNPISGTFVAGTGTCDKNGNYTITFNSLLPVGNTYQLQVMPANASGFVSSDGTAPNTYVIPTPTFSLSSGNNFVNFNVPNNSDPQTQSLSVADGMLTAYQYATDARGAAPAAVGADFYNGTGKNAATFFQNGILYVGDSDAYDFDVVEHEYGHYLQSIDNLTGGVGGPHTPGITNIGLVQVINKVPQPPLTKLQGIQLAWSEGSATFMAVASQFDNPVGYNLPVTMQNVADTYYDDYGEWDGTANTFNTSWDLASLTKIAGKNGATPTVTQLPGQGEGDEAVVQRILWSISDTNDVSWDRVQRGPVQVYKDMLAAKVPADPTDKTSTPTLSTLSQLNNYYLNTVAQNDKQRTDYGAIFQHYGVSPNPNGLMASDPTFESTDPPPTFTWDVGNNNANDTFNLIVWNDAGLTNRVIDNFLIPTLDGNSYTLSDAQWAAIDATAGTDEFVITGGDLIDPNNNAYTGYSATGPYWSDAYAFNVTVPEPASFTMLILFATATLPTRRRHKSTK